MKYIDKITITIPLLLKPSRDRLCLHAAVTTCQRIQKSRVVKSKQLLTLSEASNPTQVSGVLHFAPWEAPVSPASSKYTQHITNRCLTTPKGVFESSPEAESLERVPSAYLTYAGALLDKTGTKHFQKGEKETSLAWEMSAVWHLLLWMHHVLDDWKRVSATNMTGQIKAFLDLELHLNVSDNSVSGIIL